MTTPYSLDNAIDTFFSEYTTVSRQQCDAFVKFRVGGGQVQAVQIQGYFSYTVVAAENNKIFQFRVHDSQLDMAIVTQAKLVHPQFVPSCIYLGAMGESRPVHIYEMDNVQGTTYILARDNSIPQPPDAVLRQGNTVKDFARFFAQSWMGAQHVQTSHHDATASLSEFKHKIQLLSQSLPQRYAHGLAKVSQHLPSLFSGALPFVLTHGDLCEMNILIHPDTGNITGIVDWAEATILPFGFALWSLENLFGFMDSKGWHYFDNRRELEGLFWRTFMLEARAVSDEQLRLIRLARMAGLFCRYGLIVDGKAMKGMVGPSDLSSIGYLDAFCLGNEF
ncbi:hypothetical protein B0T19DRAFT_442706 [Cercophora scortea]|uniref:Aminoglycoside phosphotransferase domain-containing protein n=1 Tax=Cercophora scortea TaxID=314031 RepID=A0AAE0M8V4_9PEZI|nr:hypothetical protein B0T19DRAFT_442706 [Cercophora scortea]